MLNTKTAGLFFSFLLSVSAFLSVAPDLIVLEANPLESISNIRKVKLVVSQGRLFDCAKLWQSVGFQP